MEKLVACFKRMAKVPPYPVLRACLSMAKLVEAVVYFDDVQLGRLDCSHEFQWQPTWAGSVASDVLWRSKETDVSEGLSFALSGAVEGLCWFNRCEVSCGWSGFAV